MKKSIDKICGKGNGTRRWAVILMLGLIVSLLAACSSGEQAPIKESTSVTEAVEVVEVNQLGPGIIDTLSEKTPNPDLEKAIIEALQIPEEEAKKTMYLYNYVDLNADDTEEILVLLVGPYTSGSGGSTALHVLQNSNGMQVNQIMTLIREPIIISDKMTKGCHEMVVYRSGGGAEGGYVTLTSSDGQYKSVNDGTPLANLEGITGKAIMSNDILKDMEDGSALYLTN